MTPRVLLTALLLFVLAATPSGRAQNQATALTDAHIAWAEGDYVAALNGYITLLNGADGDAVLEPVALQTGELYRSFELTVDGRAPRFSPDGRHIAYEAGLEVSRRTIVVRNDAARAVVADLPGRSLTFAPNGSALAYLKTLDTPDVQAATKAVEEAPLAAQNRNALIQALNYQILRNSAIVVRDLASGQEREVAAPGLMKNALVYGADSRTLYFLGAQETDESRNDVYAIADGRTAARISEAEGFKGTLQVDPSGAVLLYSVVNQNIFRKPQPPGTGGPGGGGGGGGGGQGQQRPPSFGIIELAAGKTRTIEGATPTLAGDGKTLAYVARAGAETQLMVGAPLENATAIKKTTDRLENPALSPDGRRVAYQLMTLHDWEIHFADRDGKNETRLTRDIQHDVVPRFLSHDRLIAAVGEARHRRSFLYDLNTRLPQRLFHNNTVRTIAPEYEWIGNVAGTQLLIWSERDGDTVSPQRGVYLLDLTQKISKADLLARLRANLASEAALRAHATRVFGPISDEVRKVVDRASVARVYSYEKALFDFESKHISRPGNQFAGEYLFNTYKSFGYEPEMQWFENRNAMGGRTANVIATLKGTVNPELVYVVSSHYDSVAGGPGADDDSSGTAALLEAARVLAGHPMPATIVFASFTGEESGLLGSREYVRQAVENKIRIVGALNNDMIGWTNDQRLDNTIRYSNPGIRDIQHGAAMLFTKLITYDALYFKSTDAAAYYDAYGDIVGGIGSYPVLSNPHYHQSHDFLEFENHQLITETSKTTAATLMLLASSPSRITDLRIDRRTASGITISWAPSPEKGITSYIVSYGPASAPLERKLTVKTPRAELPALPAGSLVAVKAINARGLEGWDWARLTIADTTNTNAR